MRRTNRLTKMAAVAAALAAAASVALVTTSASALPGGTAPTGGQNLAPSSGNASSNYQLTLTAGSNTCPGDGIAGYKWTTYMVPASVDAATLTYNSGGPIAPSGVTFAQPLFSSAGSPQVSKSPGLGDGLISGIPATYSFSAIASLPVPNGEYKIGYACTKDGQTERYWQTSITVSNSTGSGFDWVKGVKPVAPVLASPLTVDNATVNGTFTHAASDPSTTGYTVTAVPAAGTTVTKALAAGSTSFSLTAADGVVNGTTYAVTVKATNSIGDSPASNSVTSPTVAPPARPAVTNLVATPGIEQVGITWTAPTGPAPTGYSIAVTAGGTPIAGSPFTAAAGATSFTRAGLTAGTAYVFTVTPTHDAPFVAGSASTAPSVPFPNNILVQDITVTRPVGALVLTQRCGVYGPLADASDAFFGSLPALAASPAAAANGAGGAYGTNPGGTAPIYSGSADPNFSEYPYPVDANGVPNPNYPTNCGVNLGIGSLITSGDRAGQYFTATGRINQITVVDTRDTDPGWTLNGTMSNFVNGSDSFSGNYLGWNPQVTDDSDATLAGYNQTVTAGGALAPALSTGLATAKPLASAPAASGLGIATLDARLKLFIPVTAKNGTFTGTLTFTTI
jgi:hypothetical protein